MNDRILRAVVAIIIIVCAAFLSCANSSAADTDLYGGVRQRDYLIGRYNPSAEKLFISLGTVGIPTRGRTQYLRIEAALALKQLYKHLKTDHPEISFWVQSATRTFDDQRAIWGNKWNGVTRVDGVKLNETIADPVARGLRILERSSMPGTSRHHWGTDVDLNELFNGYFDRGNGATLYRWMTTHAHRYGFCQPYTAGRSAGYQEERWHWSYAPLSRAFLADWMKHFGKNTDAFTAKGLFAGSEHIGGRAPLYVSSINRACE
ncbi:MAG TPA: M15 family metallopeptidase [Spirochaetota bacterium]|nr:M15 family metallopeptidase [Spirochaetota bacterium]HOS40135.1 M15 family metallopeptidase [Spirochaetota bacterium]HPI23086.1 M15 family metallopeptidase [Spirochaetota bacterium]HPU87631.1 M15 family metallopeptidase [Spirochaetota bacterium]